MQNKILFYNNTETAPENSFVFPKNLITVIKTV